MKNVIKDQAVEYTLSKKNNSESFDRKAITSSNDAYKYIKNFYYDDINIFESFFILMLNNSNETIGYAKISQGGITSTVVDVRILCKYAIDLLATGVIIAHNHPSGKLIPSHQDKQITEKIKNALTILDIKLLDHIILTDSSYTSFADQGLL